MHIHQLFLKILKKFVVNMLSNSQKGILLIILGMSIFSVQDVLVKYLSSILANVPGGQKLLRFS